MKYLCLVMFLTITGCTTMSDLSPPKSNRYFVLDENIVIHETLGLMEYKWAAGLMAGKYTLAGEDKKGYFYLSETGGVIQLRGEYESEYKSLGTIKSFSGYVSGNKMYGGKGGLWLPKEGIKNKPKLFYITKTGETSNAQVTGLVPDLFKYMLEGSLMYYIFDSPADEFKNIPITIVE